MFSSAVVLLYLRCNDKFRVPVLGNLDAVYVCCCLSCMLRGWAIAARMLCSCSRVSCYQGFKSQSSPPNSFSRVPALGVHGSGLHQQGQRCGTAAAAAAAINLPIAVCCCSILVWLGACDSLHHYTAHVSPQVNHATCKLVVSCIPRALGPATAVQLSYSCSSSGQRRAKQQPRHRGTA
jgi:hypothetical protein